MSDDKPATAKIIAFKPPKSDYVLTCPDCDGASWGLVMVDVKAGLSVSTIECCNPACGYWTQGTLQMGTEHYES